MEALRRRLPDRHRLRAVPTSTVAVMDAETLKALRGSIAKWRAIVENNAIDKGIEDCPLCARFHKWNESHKANCHGCPVRNKSGLHGCRGTPYQEWTKLVEEDDDSLVDGHPDRLVVAKAELEFLISLLPEAEHP